MVTGFPAVLRPTKSDFAHVAAARKLKFVQDSHLSKHQWIEARARNICRAYGHSDGITFDRSRWATAFTRHSSHSADAVQISSAEGSRQAACAACNASGA